MANYDAKPSILEAVGNGSYLYRFNIVEKTSEAHEEGKNEPVSPRKSWDCDEVVVWSPLTSNKITEAVITSKWNENYEQKLVNEYNAAQLGLYGEKTSEEAKAHIKAYTDYLTERAALKTQVDADCETLGIL